MRRFPQRTRTSRPEDLFERATRFVERNRLIERGDGIVLALSGGSDSVFLLHLLLRWREPWGLRLVAVHVHHGLRGEEADADEAFVKELCEKTRIPVETKRVDIGTWRRIWHLSLEEASRRARYRLLSDVLRSRGYQKIALAHHADDQIEWVLMALIRGTGSKGLGGIPRIREGSIVRPLLEIRKGEILDYLEAHGLRHREDRSNRDLSFFRNWVRHSLIPHLRTWNPRVEEGILRLSSLIRKDEAYLSQATEELLGCCLVSAEEGGIAVDLPMLSAMPPALLGRAVRRCYERVAPQDGRGLAFSHVEAVLNLLRWGRQGSQIVLPGAVWVEKGDRLLRFSSQGRKEARPFSYAVSVPGELEVPEASIKLSFELVKQSAPLVFDGRPEVAHFDAARLPDVLCVRSARPGDRFRPLGLGGTKKLQDFFTDSKIPREKRGRIPILAAEGEILWVVGWRIDERFKVTSATSKVLRACAIPIHGSGDFDCHGIRKMLYGYR